MHKRSIGNGVKLPCLFHTYYMFINTDTIENSHFMVWNGIYTPMADYVIIMGMERRCLTLLTLPFMFVCNFLCQKSL